MKNKKYIDSDKLFWKKTWTIWPGGDPGDKRSAKKFERLRIIVLPEIEEVKESFTKATKIRFGEQEDAQDGFEKFNGQF